MALCAVDPGRRQQHLAEGEALLRQASVSHNFFWFYRDAIEASLADGKWDEADRYAKALEDYTHAEPLPWCDFFVARGRALAEFGRGRRDPKSLAELRGLREEAERVALRAALPALDRALAA